MQRSELLSCQFCSGEKFHDLFNYSSPPAGETKFALKGKYSRVVVCCAGCGHYYSVHDLDLAELYSGDYVDATYGAGGIGSAFNRIISLPLEKSDNALRSRRVNEVARGHLARYKGRPDYTLLDVGSGLCVFAYAMKGLGWRCTALDPDPRATKHAEERVDVETICADFLKAEVIESFELITLNKVLEHVADPVALLARTTEFLDANGVVYVEVPDGEAAEREGSGREEFFIDHHHVFSAASLSLMVRRAGLRVQLLERLREPSTKFTLRGFLTLSECPLSDYSSKRP